MKWKIVEPQKLSEMLAAKRAVYILNTSMMNNGNKGTVIINFVDGTRKRHFIVPDTFIPLCITEAIPANELEGSADFKDLLRKNIITIVDSDQARAFLDTDEAREEYDAIVLSNHSARARGVDLESAVRKTFNSSAALTADVAEAVVMDDISTKVRALVEDLTSNTITAKEFLSQCKRHGDGFTAVDLEYIKNSTVEQGILRWVEARLLDKSSDVSAVKKKPTSLGKAMAAKKSSKKVEEDDEPASPEEEAELRRGMAQAMKTQAISGQSKVPEMIAKMVGSK